MSASNSPADLVTLADLEADPHPALARLRAAAPVSWVPALGAWLVTGYDLAVEVLRDARTFTVDDPRFSTAKVVGPSMLSLDGAQHARHRGPFNRVFRRDEVHARLASFTWTETGRLVSVIEPRGAAELRRAVAGPLAVAVMAEALGLGRTGVNRDPAVFGEPDVFDVRRPNAGRHLAFARGPHFCLGAHLARLEAQVAIGILLSRLPRLRLDPRYPSAPRGLVFRKPPDLRVRWNRSTLGAQPCHRHATCGTAVRSLAGSALFSQANRTTTSPRRSAVPLAGPVNATWPRTSSSTPQSPRLIRQCERAIRASRMTLMTVSSAPVRINLNRL